MSLNVCIIYSSWGVLYWSQLQAEGGEMEMAWSCTANPLCLCVQATGHGELLQSSVLKNPHPSTGLLNHMKCTGGRCWIFQNRHKIMITCECFLLSPLLAFQHPDRGRTKHGKVSLLFTVFLPSCHFIHTFLSMSVPYRNVTFIFYMLFFSKIK